MSIENDKLVNLEDAKVLYDDLRRRIPDVSGKLDKPQVPGTQGQVLTSDGLGGQSWEDPTGGDPTEIIDDTAGEGDTDKVLSADKIAEIVSTLNGAINGKAPIILDTASGAIASFPDGADGLPLEHLIVGIEPVQDLHGQESPYPGGGGKNLLDWELASAGGTHYGITFTKNEAEGTVTLSGTLTVNTGSVAPIQYRDYSLSGKGYVFLTEHISGDTLVALNRTYGLRTDTEKAIAVYMTGEAGSTYTETIRISVYAPPAPTVWSPYENICPISGWTGANVVRTGKNLVDLHVYSGLSYNPTVGAKINFVDSTLQFTPDSTNTNFTRQPGSAWSYQGTLLFKMLGDTSYHVKMKYTSDDCAITYGYLDKDFTVLTKSNATGATCTVDTNISKSGYTGAEYFYCLNASRVADKVITLSEPQIEVETSATDYEPVNKATYPISWQTEAGTVYGGTLDVTTGILTVTHGQIASYSGETLPGAWISDRDVYAEGTTPTTGAQVVYELAEPIVYNLSDMPTITTLLGTNNIYADTGDVEVQYRADTSLFIQKQSGSSITVDSALSSTSTNPVQNKVINTALNGKEPKHNVVSVSGTTPSITGVADTRYVCGECATLDITAPASGCIDVTFVSGSTPTVLTVTSAKANTTVKWYGGFDPSSLEANTIYEISILDGELGAALSWT